MGIWIAAAIVLILAVLPLGVCIRYNDAGFLLKVIAGPLKITVFPRKRKQKKQKKKPDQVKKGQQIESSASEEEPPRPPEAQPEQKEKGGSLTRFLPLIKLGLRFLGDFRRKLRLDNLYLRLILAGDDPCDLAVNYGRIWAAVGNLMPRLERLFVIKKRDIQVECDFAASETCVVAHLDITITLGRLLVLALVYGVRVLIEFLSMKRKGGGEK
ncbi:MAG: DUF2953 domain-containing protein [Clostridiales bacterium]|nr:DUF2953 domain-containing protein [Clostridiales bacterium]MCI6937001.1 DUF2953 domain-containing protein [Clostridiales bacterium]